MRFVVLAAAARRCARVRPRSRRGALRVKDLARVHCAMETAQGVQLVRQLSETSCIRGSEWDVERDGVWVEQGCRAEFAATRAQTATVMRRVVRCDSNGGTVACPVVLRGAPVRLLRQRSMWPCKEGRTWGVRRNEIWVSRGCDGEFEVGAEDGSGFVAVPRMVTCESKKVRGAPVACRWNARCALAGRCPKRHAWRARPGAGAATGCG